MDCATAREELSSRLDGESGGAAREELDAHLVACRACRAWRERAHELARSTRLQPGPAPRPPEALLQAVRDARAGALPGRGAMGAARAALVGVAAAQLALTVPALVLGRDRAAPVHVTHEVGSFDAAVAVGFLVAAWRPGRAIGMRTLIGAAAALLVVTALVDLALGRTGLLDEAPHLLVVAGWLLVRRLAALAPPSWDRPRSLRSALAVATTAAVRRPTGARRVAPAEAQRPGAARGASTGALARRAASTRPAREAASR